MSGSALSWDKLLKLGRNAFAVLRPCDSVILYDTVILYIRL